MRRLIPFAALLIAGCTSAPQRPQPQPGTPIPQSPQGRSGLLGMTASELLQKFGQPVLQIREGPGLKLQFRGSACVLDAYLYPSQGATGGERVLHVDTRLQSGADTDQAACIAALQRA